MLSRSLLTLSLVVSLAGASGVAAAAKVEPPANAAAKVKWDAGKGKVTVTYHGTVVLDATVTASRTGVESFDVTMQPTVTKGEKIEKVEHRLKFVAAKPAEGVKLLLRGTVIGSEEAFPAEESGGEKQKRFPYVRNSVGLSRNLRNNAVYDRRWDWVLVGPGDGKTRIKPAGQKKGKREFSWESYGAPSTGSGQASIELVFRPRFYQKHKGFEYYEPWTYKVWKGSLTGYCTWWSYRGGFVQKTLDAMLEVFVEKHLPDFGYSYMQFDNCYQPGNGSAPHNWLNWDKRKYPGGWKYAVKAIRDAGMKPGIWVHRIHRPNDPGVKKIGEEHPDWFVRKADGSLVTNRGFYMLNTTNEEAVENMVRKLYRGLKEQGWDYVKIDGTGDLLRAYQNKECDDFFKKHPTTPVQSLRKWDIVAREELGPDVYVLACHTVGNAKYVIGLVDGARLSNDGFQPRTLAQYNYLEGVVWRGDPDHCDVMGMWLMDEDAKMPVFGRKEPVPARTVIRPAICTMAGAALMLSDKLEVYQDDGNIEGMKRSSPVLDTVPGQLYSCGRKTAPWWLQEIDRPFDHWSVLARFQWGKQTQEGKKRMWELTGAPEQEVKFADLGLHADREYLVFEFWSQKFLGKSKGSFTAPAMDKNNGMDVFAIREARAHPWVISTTRHITQGGVSLLDEKWDAKGKVLSGKSKVVIGDPYVLTVHLPKGFRLKSAEVSGEKVKIDAAAPVASVRIVPSATKVVNWQIQFAK